jgi:hypothetical protein
MRKDQVELLQSAETFKTGLLNLRTPPVKD